VRPFLLLIFGGVVADNIIRAVEREVSCLQIRLPEARSCENLKIMGVDSADGML
jgi:hypothetical protein